MKTTNIRIYLYFFIVGVAVFGDFTISGLELCILWKFFNWTHIFVSLSLSKVPPFIVINVSIITYDIHLTIMPCRSQETGSSNGQHIIIKLYLLGVKSVPKIIYLRIYIIRLWTIVWIGFSMSNFWNISIGSIGTYLM